MKKPIELLEKWLIDNGAVQVWNQKVKDTEFELVGYSVHNKNMIIQYWRSSSSYEFTVYVDDYSLTHSLEVYKLFDKLNELYPS